MAVFTEGVCKDGAAILQDGELLTVEEILNHLNNNICCWGECGVVIANDRLLCKKHFYRLSEEDGKIVKDCVDIIVALEKVDEDFLKPMEKEC